MAGAGSAKRKHPVQACNCGYLGLYKDDFSKHVRMMARVEDDPSHHWRNLEKERELNGQ